MIDTHSVSGRRTLRFESIDDMLADARSLAAAPKLQQLGNWSLGQAINHVAAWIDYPYLGYPPELNFPEPAKLQARAAMDRLMNEPMRPGERLPGLPAGTLAIDDLPVAEALPRLEAAAARLRSAEPTHPDPVFGPLTAHQWTLMTLRHAELHFSFFIPS